MRSLESYYDYDIVQYTYHKRKTEASEELRIRCAGILSQNGDSVVVVYTSRTEEWSSKLRR